MAGAHEPPSGEAGLSPSAVPHIGRRFQMFLRDLRNAGLLDEDVEEIAALARGFGEMFRSEPTDLEQVRIFARIESNGSPERAARIETLLGAWSVWVSPSSEIDPRALLRGVIGFDADVVVRVADESLAGKGRVGAWLERVLDAAARQSIRDVLGPVAIILLIILAFLENPMFRIWSGMLGARVRAPRVVASEGDVKASTERATLAAAIAKRIGPEAALELQSPVKVEELSSRLRSGELERLASLADWTVEVLDDRQGPVWVFTGKDAGAIIVVEAETTCAIDTSLAVAVEGYR